MAIVTDTVTNTVNLLGPQFQPPGPKSPSAEDLIAAYKAYHGGQGPDLAPPYYLAAPGEAYDPNTAPTAPPTINFSAPPAPPVPFNPPEFTPYTGDFLRDTGGVQEDFTNDPAFSPQPPHTPFYQRAVEQRLAATMRGPSSTFADHMPQPEQRSPNIVDLRNELLHLYDLQYGNPTALPQRLADLAADPDTRAMLLKLLDPLNLIGIAGKKDIGEMQRAAYAVPPLPTKLQQAIALATKGGQEALQGAIGEGIRTGLSGLSTRIQTQNAAPEERARASEVAFLDEMRQKQSAGLGETNPTFEGSPGSITGTPHRTTLQAASELAGEPFRIASAILSPVVDRATDPLINALPADVAGKVRTIRDFATSALPYAIPGTQVLGLAQITLQTAAAVEAYKDGKIDATGLAKQLALSLGPLAAMLIVPRIVRAGRQAAGDLAETLKSPEGQQLIQKLQEERGGGTFGEKPPSEADKLGVGEPAPELPPEQAGTEGATEIPGSLTARLAAQPVPVDEASLAVSEWLRKGEKARPEQEAMFAAQRSEQFAKMESAMAENGPDAHLKARGLGAGAFQRPELAPLDLSPEMESMIRGEINTSTIFDHPGQRLQAHEALDAMLTGHLPQPAQGIELGKILGPTVVDQLGSRLGIRNLGQAIEKYAGELANAPRELMATADLSATLRQGAIFAVAHPLRTLQAFAEQLKALVSEKAAQRVADEIVTHPDYHLAEGRVANLDANTTNMNLREEAFQSHLVERLPIIGPVAKAANRAFVTFTNKLRHDVFYDQVKNWRSSGVELTPDRLNWMGDFVNNATGRGKLPRWLENHAATLNAINFSPRFLASRAALVGDLVRSFKDPALLKVAAKDLGSFVATGVGILTLLKETGAAKVQLDPRSSDFGKFQIGNQRHDFWAGFGPIARLIAQEAPLEALSGDFSAKKVSVDSMGRNVAIDVDRTGLLSRFLRTKLSPVASLIVDVHLGTTLTGQAVDTDAFKELNGNNPILQRVTPLFFQDAFQAYKQGGLPSAATALPAAVLGEGVQTYDASTATADKEGAKQELDASGFNAIEPKKLQEPSNQTVLSFTLGIPKEQLAQYQTLADLKDAYAGNATKGIVGTQTQKYIDLGMTPDDAKSAAGKDFTKATKSVKDSITTAELFFWLKNKDLLKSVSDRKGYTPSAAEKKLIGVP